MKYLSVLTLFALGVLLFSPVRCADEIHSSRLTEIQKALDGIQEKFVPDRRIAVFDIEADGDDPRRLIVRTDIADAAIAVDRLIQETPAWSQNIKLVTLPEESLGDQTRALVRVSVANMRRTPRHQAELIDQAIMGTPLKVLRRQGSWYYIQTPWGYLGWVTRGSLSIITEDQLSTWENRQLVYVDAVDTRVYDRPSSNANIVTDVTLGAVLRQTGRTVSGFTPVELPDQRTGFIASSELTSADRKATSSPFSASSLIETANRFHGLPYLWGGNSGKGFDCSGFTNTVFRHHGIVLPRDANMQYEVGEIVMYDDTYDAVEPGDLLFFGPNPDRITHVAISLGGARYIHAATYVQINSLDESDEDFNAYRHRTLVGIRRIAG